MKLKLNSQQQQLVESMLRVNQAGELAAVRIYQGQMLVLGRPGQSNRPILQHMLEQEKVHLATFNRLLPDYRVRPTAMRPLWNVAGLALGVSSALLGPRGAMMCTEAVETVIGEHYNDQLRQLHQLKSMNNNPNDGFQQLRQTIKKFRDEELEHLDHAVSRESRQAPMHSILSEVIKSGCRAAIWISERI